MRELFCILASVLLLTGCSNTDTMSEIPVSKHMKIIKESALPASQNAEPETEEPTLSIAERAAQMQTAAEEVYIYDECEVLSELEQSLYNGYLAWLEASYLIHAAVVITDHLDGNAPLQFAETYYQTLFADSENNSGFLLLINNDTNQDVLYTVGICQTAITEDMFTTALVKATPCLVEGRYGDALEILLPLGENCPLSVFDRTGTLSDAELQEFIADAQILQEDTGKQCDLLLLSQGEDFDIETYREQLHSDILLAIDPQTKQCQLAGSVSEPDAFIENILRVWESRSLAWAIREFYTTIQN